ncbi:MAG: aminodeoxychorismate synthase component I, partial [Thermodesulfobacteriota bacterium]
MKDLDSSGLIEQLPFIEEVYQETIAPGRPFQEIAALFADDPGSTLLLSGSDLDCSRYNILAVKPWLEITGKHKSVFIKCQGRQFHVKQDPFSVIQALLDKFKFNNDSFDLPLLAGLFGYFSYDLKDIIEKLPCTCIDSGLPDLCLYAPCIILIQDKKTDQTTLCIPLLSNELKAKTADEIININKNFFFNRLEKNVKRKPFCIDKSGFKSSFTKKEYIASVNKIIEYLKAGDIYQANLSQRFEAGFSGDAYSLFQDLFKRNPASFFSYINAGDHIIVSTSPERFIKQNGRHVESRPIKGTIARGITKEEDKKNGLTLTKSIKDDAELTMIVDLMRNDISRVTKHGSVIVKEHKRLEAYENVFHLVSVVQGELEDDKTSVDLLKATFPGGSITGCPKIRSMEIIDELESVKRHIYTGSIGYISFHDAMDLSIAIRTATIVDNRVFFSVGGGIVYDSDPEKEFQETLDKGKTLMESLSGSLNLSSSSDNTPKLKAWVNGKIIDQDKAVVSAAGPGFQYGAGLFETIRVDQGKICHLKDHLSRLNRAWKKLFFQTLPHISWENVIYSLIKENRFQDRLAAVKLLLSKSDHDSDSSIFMAAFARPYTHRLEILEQKGLHLITYPHPRQSPLSDYKTLNYLYYERAGQFAKDHQGDEAIILNPDFTVSETNTASIFAIRDRSVMVPESLHVLDGVTLKSVLTILSNKGYGICKKPVPKEQFYLYPNIMVTNALMGAVKVLSIDKKRI